ncbi:MAG TPA: hypothetical protein VK540_22175 [Polyangiaceae bacterium]|nr:hypothetical protein [Polyangiaceae bacterium]
MFHRDIETGSKEEKLVMPKSTPRTPQSRSSTQNSGAAPTLRTGQKNEGEGNRTAARRYDRAVEKTVKSGTVTEKARAAARALEGPEGSELRRAEAQAKRGKPASENRTVSK